MLCAHVIGIITLSGKWGCRGGGRRASRGVRGARLTRVAITGQFPLPMIKPSYPCVTPPLSIQVFRAAADGRLFPALRGGEPAVNIGVGHQQEPHRVGGVVLNDVGAAWYAPLSGAGTGPGSRKLSGG